VRGYSYQGIGPTDPNGAPVGGRSLTEFSLEARVKAFGNFGIVPFLDAGNIYTSALPKFTGMRFGTGLGLRYYSNFGPIRIDVGTPINRRPGEPRVAVYVSLGQAF
jgi:translocation and assembly module TamA